MNRRWKILITALAALAVLILLPIVRHYQLRAATEAYIAQLKAQGEPMTLAQIVPPPVPPEQNSADTMQQIAALLKRDHDWWDTNIIDGMRMFAPGKAMVGWQQPQASSDIYTNSWKNIGDALGQDREILDLSRKIIAKPDFDFHLQYDLGVGDLAFTNFFLADAKSTAQRLATATLYDLHAGDAGAAMENVRAIIAITQALRDEQFVISELVRIVIAQIGMSANWEILQSTNVTDAQLAQLQQDWASLDFIHGGENAILMERTSGDISLAKWQSSNTETEQFFQRAEDTLDSVGMGNLDEEMAWHKLGMKTKIFLWRYWWSYPDELRSQKGYKVLLNTFRMAQTNGSFQSAVDYQNDKLYELRLTNVPDIFDPNPDFHSFISGSIGGLRAVIYREMTIASAKQIMITAIALKRYQLKHGNCPATLDALVPEFLPATPIDPVDGKPLRYRRNSDGTFLLYSIAKNDKDDGGNGTLGPGATGVEVNPGWLNRYALDWVWPQPATAKEIQNYYAHPPK